MAFDSTAHSERDTRAQRPAQPRGARQVVLGIVLIALGAVSILAAFTATLATVLLFAVLLLAGGVAQVLHALSSRAEHFGWELATGIGWAVVGGLLIADPVAGAIGLTLLIGLFFLLAGAVRVSLGLRLRRTGGPAGLFLVLAALDGLLGLLILLGWPATSAWVIGLFLGIELLFGGFALLMGRMPARGGIVPG